MPTPAASVCARRQRQADGEDHPAVLVPVDDLARVLGPMPAHQIAQLVRGASGAVRQGLAALARLVPERRGS